ELHVAGRSRLCGAAGPFQRSEAEAHRAAPAHHRPRQQNRRRDAGGADASRRACAPRPRQAGEIRLSKRGQGVLDLSDDRARALALTVVSRETTARLDRFVALLLAWQQKTNLIAPSTIPHLWTRHVADSLQLLEHAPADARMWVDFGSGGGF